MTKIHKSPGQKIIYLLLIICSLGGIWFIMDKQLFYTGKSTCTYKSNLPYGVRPYFRYSFEGGFTLTDKYEMPSIGPFSQINDHGVSDTVARVTKYGVGNGRVFAYVATTGGKTKFVEIIKDIPFDRCSDCLSTAVLTSDPGQSVPVTWYIVPGDKLTGLELCRNITGFLIIVLCLGWIFLVFKTILK